MNKKVKQTALPKLRFPEFRGYPACEKLELSKLLVETKNRNRELKYDKNDVLSVSGEYGCVNQIEFLGRSYAGVSVKDYHIVETGDIVYTKSPLKQNPYGIIKENKGRPGIVSTLYAVYRTTNLCTPDYLDHYFSRDYNLNSYLQPLVNKGAKNDMKVKNSDVLTGEIFVPKPIEQQKISHCLSSIDALLGMETQKLEALHNHKKGLAQQLFPMEGKGLPKCRFPEFQDAPEWKQRKINQLFDRVTTKNKDDNKNVLTISAKDGLVSQESYFNKRVSSTNLTGYFLIDKGDFAYNKSYSKGYPMGAIKPLKLYEKGVVSTLYICFRPKSEVNADFWEQYFDAGAANAELEKIAQEGARNHGLLNISVVEFFRSVNLYIPSPEEQQKIASFLLGLDGLISKQSSIVERIQQHKQGLMQKLFPLGEEVL